MNNSQLLNFTGTNNIINCLIELLNPVKESLGPNGNTVFINNFSTTLTKDGATILKSISCNDIYTYTILNFIKDNINNLSLSVGDGTTSTIVLLMELLKNIILIESYNVYVKDIILGIEKSLNYLNTILPCLSKSIDINDKVFIKNLGTISTNGNEKLGQLLLETINQVGKDGIINIEKVYNWNNDIVCDYQKGCYLDVGYSHPYFTYINNESKTNIILQNPYILISKKPLTLLTEPLESLLNFVITQKKPLLIIASSIEGDFLNNLMMIHNRNLLTVVPVKYPYNYEGFIEDIQIITGSKWWDHHLLQEPYESYLGTSPLVEINKYKTIISGSQTDLIINQHINHLKQLNIDLKKNNNHSSFENIILNQRIAKLTGGIGYIKIGGSNEAEKDEIKDRLTDGVYSIQSALKEGITLGGGITWLLLSKFLQEAYDNKLIIIDNEYQLKGLEILQKSLKVLLITIIKKGTNVNKENFNTIENFYKNLSLEFIDQAIKNQDYLLCFNGKNSQLCNLWESGIINSLKVEKTSLNTAINLFINIINSSYIINPS
jgi:chaperonin GroEL